MRVKPASLPSAEEVGILCLDLRSTRALESLKKLLEKPPIPTTPAPGELMLLYITSTTQVVSTALVVERDEPNKVLKVQQPVYLVSEVLSDYKTRYPHIPEAHLCRVDLQKKAQALFQHAPYHGGFEIPVQRGDPDP
jgi:hypothetical protein